MKGRVSLTAANVVEVEMFYFWISSVFALNSSTDLISVFTKPPGNAVLIKLIKLILGRELFSTLEEGF